MRGSHLQAQVFTKAVLYLRDLGFISDGEKLPSVFLSTFMLVGLLMILGLIGDMYIEYGRQSKTEFFRSLVFLICLMFQTSVTVSFYLCGKKSEEFVSRICRHDFGVSDNFPHLVKNIDKITAAIYNFIIVGYAVFTMMNRSFEQCSQTKRKRENSNLYFCGVYGESWYPVPLDFTPVKQIFLVLQVVELVYYLPKLNATLVFFHGSIELIEYRIEDLKCFLSDTVVTDTNVEEVNKRLKYAVKKFVEITENGIWNIYLVSLYGVPSNSLYVGKDNA